MSSTLVLSCIYRIWSHQHYRIYSGDDEELYAECDLAISSTEQLKAFFASNKVK